MPDDRDHPPKPVASRIANREAALRDILKIISQNRGDTAPVFDLILNRAAHLCCAPHALLMLRDDAGQHLELVASNSAESAFINEVRKNPHDLSNKNTLSAQVLDSMETAHFPDMQDAIRQFSKPGQQARVAAEIEGMRSLLLVPLINGETAIGVLALYKLEIAPFEEDEISLVEAFATQAVIAIENVRQFRELQTRLEREAATREILHVISQNRDDEMPVFEAILERAQRLCHAQAAGLQLVNPERTKTRMIVGVGSGERAFKPGEEFDLDGPSALARAVHEARVIHLEDTKNSQLYRDGHPLRVKLVDEEGVRTQLTVPLLKNGVAFGTMTLSRYEQRPFSEDEIALVETFASQAVIAIENVRQFRELQTRLEREKATREVLSVISQSRDDVQPVFDVLLERAVRLCGAPFACLFLANPDRTHLTIPASFGTRSEFVELINNDPLPLDPSQALTAKSIVEKRSLHVADFRDDPIYRSGQRHRVHAVEVEGIRTVLTVPLIVGDEAIGVIVLYRREVSLFKEDEIALVQTFAQQAAIAIENVRQFRELQTRLEREEASREILQVISASRTDSAPVFDVILRNAARLSGAPLANLCLMNEARSHWHLVAHFGDGLRHLTVGGAPRPMESKLLPAVVMRTAQVTQIEDLSDTDLYRQGDPGRVAMVDVEGMRTIVCVPLLKGAEAIGSITLFRREVKAFTPDEIALVETFAAQAVIAIENVRQFREVQDRLEREAALREILSVISRSRDDEMPVFAAITRKACELCNADTSALMLGRPDQKELRMAQYHFGEGTTTPQGYEGMETIRNTVMAMDPDVHISAEAICTGQMVHIEDLSKHPSYKNGDPSFKTMVDVQNERSAISVPLVDDLGAMGAINLYRQRIERFSEDEIELVRMFAAQAVIAIENVRQFKALEDRTAEVESLNAGLEERVETQVGELERMGRLKRFLSPQVADAIVSTGSDKLLTSHRSLLGILFCDIRGFTAFCETAEPEETIEVLQTYHEEMGKLIVEHGAGVDHRSGDGIMVLFNDPLPCDDPAGEALRLGLAMKARMQSLCAGWKRLGHRLGFGVGISLGYATVGMVGSEGRFDYTASGTAVNLASRLCDTAEDGEILLSPRARTAVEDDYVTESAGAVSLKGIREPVEAFRVIDSQA